MRDEAHPRRWLFFCMVSTGIFLSTMDSSMVNIALPSIMRSFSVPLFQVEWVILIYLMTITTTLLIWGRISDRFGKGRIYIWGMLLFSFGATCCYFSPTLKALIGSRFLQGLGASMMMATGPAIIRLVFPRELLGRALGSLGIATSIGLVSGPITGGYFLHHFSWRVLFLVTVPVNLCVLVVSWVFLAGRVPQVFTERSRTDWAGGILWILLISFFVFATSFIHNIETSTQIGGGILFAFLCYVFLRVEMKVKQPLLPISLLKERYYGVAMLTASISFAVLFVILILMPFYLDYILGLEVKKIGFVMMAVPITLFIISPISGWLYDRIGAKGLTTSGLLLSCFAIISLCFLQNDSSAMAVSLRLAMLGAGQSIFLSPNTASVLARIDRKHTGVTSGMLATSRNLGMLLGVALSGLIFMSFYLSFSGGLELKEFTINQTGDFMMAFRLTLGGAAIIAFSGSLLSWKRTQ